MPRGAIVVHIANIESVVGSIECHLAGLYYCFEWKVKLLLCLSAGGLDLNIVYAFVDYIHTCIRN